MASSADCGRIPLDEAQFLFQKLTSLWRFCEICLYITFSCERSCEAIAMESSF